MTEYISPAFTLVVGIALWRLLHADMVELGKRIDRINERLDRHLEGHS